MTDATINPYLTALRHTSQRDDAVPAQQAPPIIVPRSYPAPPPPPSAQPPAAMQAGIGKITEAAEVRRVMELPIVRPMTEAEVLEFSKMMILADAFRDGFRLWGTQANSIYATMLYGGILGPIGVGWGKTLISLMAAGVFYTQYEKQKILLLIPPEVASQLVDNDIAFARRRVQIPYPIHVLCGRHPSQRISIAKSNRPGLYIMAYSQLSTKDTDEVLGLINPDVVIGDEAHRISKPRAARTQRVSRFLRERETSTHGKVECSFLSGTLTSKSVMDYYYLAKAALGDRTPLPLSESMAFGWGDVVDAEKVEWESAQHQQGAVESNTNGPGPLLPLVEWARANFPAEAGALTDTREGFRRAYQIRLDTAPGVVMSGDAEISTSLILDNIPVPKHKECEGWQELQELLDRVEKLWETPNGDPIDHAIHKWKWRDELSVGFYNELIWPQVEHLAHRRRISEGEATTLLERSMHYYEEHKCYVSELRKWLERFGTTGVDTPMLVGNALKQIHDGKAQSNDRLPELYPLWLAKEQADFEGRMDRDRLAVRVSPYKIDAAVRWAHEHAKSGGVIWYHHQEVGLWLYEALTASDPPFRVRHCPAGPAHNEAIIDKANRDCVVIASISAHGTGKNLQHFHSQYVMQWPRGAKAAEQMLGRLHRNGQEKDEIVCHTNRTILHDDLVFAACLNDSAYIHQTTSRQKLLYAVYAQRPRIYPSGVLREAGAQGVETLTIAQRSMLDEKFGKND